MNFSKLALILSLITGCGADQVRSKTDNQTKDPETSESNIYLNHNWWQRSDNRGAEQRKLNEELRNTCNYVFQCRTSTVDDLSISQWTPVGPQPGAQNRCEAGFECPRPSSLSGVLLQQCDAQLSIENIVPVSCTPISKKSGRKQSVQNRIN
jgi:hypothetical protein